MEGGVEYVTPVAPGRHTAAFVMPKPAFEQHPISNYCTPALRLRVLHPYCQPASLRCTTAAKTA